MNSGECVAKVFALKPPVKLLFFAHKPPPHHGQSYMVQLVLEAFGGDARSESHADNGGAVICYHLDCRFSDGMEDIGRSWFPTTPVWLQRSRGCLMRALAYYTRRADWVAPEPRSFLWRRP